MSSSHEILVSCVKYQQNIYYLISSKILLNQYIHGSVWETMHICVCTCVCEFCIFIHMYLCCNNIKQREDWNRICEYKYLLIWNKVFLLKKWRFVVWCRCGVVFLGEEGECVSVMVKGRVCHYKKLNTLEFTSGKLSFW